MAKKLVKERKPSKTKMVKKPGSFKIPDIRKRNILQQRLPEIRDLPAMQKLSIFGRGSLIGEDDVFFRENFSCSLKCYSQKGTVYELGKEYFQLLKSSDQSLLAIMENILQKELKL